MPVPPPVRSWIEEADVLARRIVQDAIKNADHGLTWLHPTSRKPIGPHLYNGTTGIALFLAALAHASSSPGRYRDPSLASIASLRDQLKSLTRKTELATGVSFRLGGMAGLGGYIYAFTRIGIWLKEPALVEEAQALTLLLSPENIAKDNDLDTLTGSAGAILALLSLHQQASGPNARGDTPLDLARACGKHLLDKRSPQGLSARAWPPSTGGPALCGFAHGAAGISYALGCLYRVTRDEEFRTAALEGIRYEASHYNPSRRNWRDLRNLDEEVYMTGWCNGSAGIALSRSRLLDIGAMEEIRRDLDNALASVLSAPLSRQDHLCCGNMGRVEALLEASSSLGTEGARAAASDLAFQVLDRARRSDGSLGQLAVQDPPAYDPSLLRGASGLGLSLLRLEISPQTPCILLME